MRGPGKYDDVLTEAREKTKADGAVLIVMGGDKGDGFAVQVPIEKLFGLPDVLEYMAKQIRADLDRYKA
jgi:hypothetical protein